MVMSGEPSSARGSNYKEMLLFSYRVIINDRGTTWGGEGWERY